MTHALRRACDRDFEQVHAWRAEAYRPYVERWHGGWDDLWQRDHLRAAWDGRERWIVVVDGMDVGVLDVEVHADHLLVGNVVLAPAARGRGLGTAVLREQLARAATLGLPARLKVFRDNPAVRLYARLGFAETEGTASQVWMERPVPTAPTREPPPA
ncbi:MAG: GNAT family N-acetyltransferase [Alphaproteobacteria bacterium]|nr:GNAT family N-acetyltransferase [Alphaproteobacteria bacterium]